MHYRRTRTTDDKVADGRRYDVSTCTGSLQSPARFGLWVARAGRVVRMRRTAPANITMAELGLAVPANVKMSRAVGKPGSEPAPPRKAAKSRRAADVIDPAEVAEKISSVDQIVAEIRRGLYDGRYVAGQKLTESDLTKKFGVGRGSVREALRRLAAEGIVTVSLHRGASIRALSRDDVRDVLEVIEALSGLSARLAAERVSRPQDEKALMDMLYGLSHLAASGDPFAFARMRNRFYRLLAQLSGNRELARLIPLVQATLVRVQFRAAYGTEKQRMGDYKKVIEAILAHDPNKAEKAMRQHIRGTARAIQLLTDNNFG